jgi:AcrR family transcriptional regulator
MAIIVEHDKRKHEILQKSIDVFIEEGYEDATFQKIADRCGITRTTLYIYFNNKHEIFLGSIKELLTTLEQNLYNIVNDVSLNAKQALNTLFDKMIDEISSNQKLFCVLLNYLMQIKKSGVDPNERVRRRVIRLRHYMSTIIIRGMKSNELKQTSVKTINDLLFSLVQASIFKLTVLNIKDVTDMKSEIELVIDGLLQKN